MLDQLKLIYSEKTVAYTGDDKQRSEEIQNNVVVILSEKIYAKWHVKQFLE
jgi:hypothetical protein